MIHHCPPNATCPEHGDPVDAMITVNTVYKIPARGRSKGRSLTIRVERIIYTGNDYTIVIGWRVRPTETNVSFGNPQIYARRTDDFIIVP